MVEEFGLGYVIRLRKTHPCGGSEWEVLRLGADIRLRCLVCDRRVMMSRVALEKRLKTIVTRRPAT